MKKNFLAILAIAIAIGTSAFTAITKAEDSKNQQQYYWFGLTGTYLGRSANVPSGCDEVNLNNCAYVFINVADPDDPEQPSGSPDKTAKKP